MMRRHFLQSVAGAGAGAIAGQASATARCDGGIWNIQTVHTVTDGNVSVDEAGQTGWDGGGIVNLDVPSGFTPVGRLLCLAEVSPGETAVVRPWVASGFPGTESSTDSMPVSSLSELSVTVDSYGWSYYDTGWQEITSVSGLVNFDELVCASISDGTLKLSNNRTSVAFGWRADS
jgi:hypothetical protein